MFPPSSTSSFKRLYLPTTWALKPGQKQLRLRHLLRRNALVTVLVVVIIWALELINCRNTFLRAFEDAEIFEKPSKKSAEWRYESNVLVYETEGIIALSSTSFCMGEFYDRLFDVVALVGTRNMPEQDTFSACFCTLFSGSFNIYALLQLELIGFHCDTSIS